MRELTYCFLFQTTSENVTRRIALRPLGTPFAVSSSRLDTKAISNRFLKSPLMQTEQYSTSQFARDVDTCVRKSPTESEVLRWNEYQDRENREGQREDQHEGTRDSSRQPWHP